MLRYLRNKHTITEQEQTRLASCKVCIIGLGGLGGYVLELLARIGVENIRVVDGDCFDETNLNRQLLSDEAVIGFAKTEVAAKRTKLINASVRLDTRKTRITSDNARDLLDGCDVVIDACDSIETKKLLQSATEKQGIPLVYGAIGGWYGQVCVVFPGDKTLDKIYGVSQVAGAETIIGNPSFTPAAVAAVQVSQTIKLLLGKGGILGNKMLYIDLLENHFEVINL
ncbi:MAG: ThiF family adenylyltransferase [Clostridia bacterium]|nr:ThiF family adenylyltransferase [Clostridia bacterium]